MAIVIEQWSPNELTIISEPTGSRDGEELHVSMRSVDALIKKLQTAKRKHEREMARRAKG